MVKALVTGINGQDGGYIAEFLIKKGYEVYGMYRRSSGDKHLEKIQHLIGDIHLVQGDLLDSHSLDEVIKKVRPNEIYNLAAQSQVQTSFSQPHLTQDINWFGVQRLFTSCEKWLGKDFKFYQASTSELFGDVLETPQNENTPFNPISPYSKAKLEAHNFIARKREEGYFACAGILFNHESPKRSLEFVTRKVTDGAARFKLGLAQRLTGKSYIELGNLESKRDWGYAKDYVEAMWLLLQQDKPKDYVIATGENHTIRELCEEAFTGLGMSLQWTGEDINEQGMVDGIPAVQINPDFYRPSEVQTLLGDASLAKKELGWYPLTKFKDLVKIMVDSDHAKNTKQSI